ncbi:MAG: helix-turn-helix domain-containing protein [Pseudonocardiaceae bacterium]
MSPTHGPIVPRKRLGTELKRLRDESDRTLDEVAHTLMISTSKLSRLENAQGSPQARDVRDLAVYYEVAETALGERLMRWAREGRRQGWWADYDEVIHRNESFDTYLAYETEATIARVYTIPYVTGLLQTADYTRALTSAMWRWNTDKEVDRLVQVRLRRQQGLTHREGLPPLELRAILHESCLTQFVGSAEIMRAQLETLLKAPSMFPKVDLRVLPASAEPHQMNTCTWSYFMFSDSLDRDVVHLETHAGYRHIESDEQVKRYDRGFEELSRHSLIPEESNDLIRSVLRNS